MSDTRWDDERYEGRLVRRSSAACVRTLISSELAAKFVTTSRKTLSFMSFSEPSKKHCWSGKASASTSARKPAAVAPSSW